MGCIAHELAHLRLRFCLRIERGLDLGEHGVQRRGKTTNLIAGVVVLNTLGQIPFSDLRRRLLHARQRLESAGDNHPRHCNSRGERGQPEREGEHTYESNHLVGLLQG